MSTVMLLADDGATHRTPLICHSSAGESLPPATSAITTEESNEPKQRLVSLDVFRGLTVALMILVDDAGKAFPTINHSPWFGITLADFVMPFFLFGVGVSVSLVFKNVSNKSEATKKAIFRTIKLFIIGVILQGGYFHGRDDLTYGVDIGKIRWMGILQRISIGYILASLMEIWLVNFIVVDSTISFLRRYSFQLAFTIGLGSLYMALLYGLYVPDWTFKVTSPMNSSYGYNSIDVQCGVRGSLEPSCNAVGLIDRFLLGEQHLYQRPVYKRTKDCSVNSPDYGPLPPNAPGWCLAPFDPEGILSSLMAALTCFVGLQYGHILVHVKDNNQRLTLWAIISLPLLLLGYFIEIIGVPLSKPLYTLSYMFVTAGSSGFLLSIIFYIVDIIHVRMPMLIFQWMGMNALIVYALAACDIFPAVLQGFYWHAPENNLVTLLERGLQAMLHSEKWGTLIFVMLEIIFWGLFAGFLHMKRVYVKL